MRGDCSIRVGPAVFTAAEVAACAAANGLLSLELELDGSGVCGCEVCRAGPGGAAVLRAAEIEKLLEQARELGCRRCILVDDAGAWRRELEAAIDAACAAKMGVEVFCGAGAVTLASAAWLAERKVAVALWRGALGNASAERAFHAAVANLKSAGFGQPGMPVVSVRAAAGDGTAEEMVKLWRWCRVEGIAPRFQIFVPASVEQAAAFGTADALKGFYEELARVDAAEFQQHWELPAALTGRSCNRHLYACHVTACGTVFACVGVTIPLGNIRTTPLVEMVGGSEVLENLRAFHGHVKEPCNSCSKGTDCYGCRGSAYQLTGDYLAGDQMCWKADGVTIESLPIAVGMMIPHGPSMRAVDRLMKMGNKTMEAEYVVGRNSPLVDAAGVLDDTAYVEMIAQTFAASQTFDPRPGDSQTREGYLLGIKNLAVLGQARVGDVLKIAVRKTVRFGDFCFVEGMISQADGTVVAHGEVKLYRPATDANAGVQI